MWNNFVKVVTIQGVGSPSMYIYLPGGPGRDVVNQEPVVGPHGSSSTAESERQVALESGNNILVCERPRNDIFTDLYLRAKNGNSDITMVVIKRPRIKGID